MKGQSEVEIDMLMGHGNPQQMVESVSSGQGSLAVSSGTLKKAVVIE